MAKVCPECGSTLFTRHGYTVINRAKVQRFMCKRCFRSFTYFAQSGRLEKKTPEPFNDMEKEV
jgi:transposase-like protein